MLGIPLELVFGFLGVIFGSVATYFVLRRRDRRRDQSRHIRLGESGSRVYGAIDPTRNYRTVSDPLAAPNSGQASQDGEIEAIKTKLATMERAIRAIQEDMVKLCDERDLGGQHLGITIHNRPLANGDAQKMTKPAAISPIESGGSFIAACDAYLSLSVEGLLALPVEPLFVVLDMDSSARGSAVGETKRSFKQSDSKQSAFVIFTDGTMSGWIFPNPRISFTEAMKYVFPNLSYENFEEAKNGVKPHRVRTTGDGVWETVST